MLVNLIFYVNNFENANHRYERNGNAKNDQYRTIIKNTCTTPIGNSAGIFLYCRYFPLKSPGFRLPVWFLRRFVKRFYFLSVQSCKEYKCKGNADCLRHDECPPYVVNTACQAKQVRRRHQHDHLTAE